MAEKLAQIENRGHEEINKNQVERQEREHNLKKPNMDVNDLRVLRGGFVSIQ